MILRNKWPYVTSTCFESEKMAIRSSGSQNKSLLGEEDATLVFETSKEVTVTPTFDAMGLHEDLLRGIYAYGRNFVCSLSQELPCHVWGFRCSLSAYVSTCIIMHALHSWITDKCMNYLSPSNFIIQARHFVQISNPVIRILT